MKIYLLTIFLPIILSSYFCSGFLSTLQIISMYNSRQCIVIIHDEEIKSKIRYVYTSNYVYNLSKTISFDVFNSRVLLTGQVIDFIYKIEAEKLLYFVLEIKEVINDIYISNTSTNCKYKDFQTFLYIKIAMLTSKSVNSLKYKIIVYNKIIYILGKSDSIADLNSMLALVACTAVDTYTIKNFIKL